MRFLVFGGLLVSGCILVGYEFGRSERNSIQALPFGIVETEIDPHRLVISLVFSDPEQDAINAFQAGDLAFIAVGAPRLTTPGVDRLMWLLIFRRTSSIS